jgi:hypothetical protein
MAVEAIIFTQIVDVNWDQAIYTTGQSITVNMVQLAAKGSGSNIGIALTPKGSGYVSLQVPDATAVGGNRRGDRAVDLQLSRIAATQVASGARSFAAGYRNTASATYAVSLGENNISSGLSSFTANASNTASGENSFACGALAVSSANSSFASGSRPESHLTYMRAHGGFGLSVAGGSQEIALVLANRTTTDAEVVLQIFTGIAPVLRANSVWSVILHIVGSKSDGSAVARYHRQVTIKRVVNTTSLVGSVITLGTDEAAGTSINITADDATDRLSVGVTGIAAETWRWVAVIHGVEMLIGA